MISFAKRCIHMFYKARFFASYGKHVTIGKNCGIDYRKFRPKVNRLIIGDGVRFGNPLRLVGNHYVFGDHFYCGREVIFGGGPRSHFEVGKYSSVATRSSFLMGQGNHRPQSLSSFPFGHAPCFDDSQWTQSFDYEKESTTYCKLGNDVWIGVGTIVLPNVTIGDGAIVSAGSVVKEDVPAYSVVGGNPAQVISFRFKQELIQELVEMKWWDWPVEKINRNKELFTKNLITRKSLNKVSVYD